MPKRNDLKKVLILGSGPIVIGQACEFDYSGTQACKALMAEGLEVILVNSNPATIMTDPDIATRVYIEPLLPISLDKILEIEKPDALIPTLGGQTALNLALELDRQGILKKHNVQMLGADPKVIQSAEDRELFRDILDQVGARYPVSFLVRNMQQAIEASEKLKFPLILRPNYTLGGGGGGISYNIEEYKKMMSIALHESPTSEVLVEASILGWKEFELEVMHDAAGTFVVVCTIENFDPCGVHTGDSITVAPQQTLSDQDYQAMRDEACKILRKVGVQTGGANIQFAVHPKTGERVVIEMNPRVSRSSALASKATGFPIAKIAALLAIGYNLNEITNDITGQTPCCFEPALDYVVTKIPKFSFEKFPGAQDLLTTQMKSVGEAMGIGRTLEESLMKALLSMELHPEGIPDISLDIEKISFPNSLRIYHLFQAFREGHTVSQLQDLTQINQYFLEKIDQLVAFEKDFKENFKLSSPSFELLVQAKRYGFSDARLATLAKVSENEIRELRFQNKLHPGFFQVDTCAGEFKSETPYFYSSYWVGAGDLSVVSTSTKNILSKLVSKPIAILGGGPNRIGQGIEFDYSCVRGVKALQRFSRKVVMINSNPETVSTDYDTADLLFFEPLHAEFVDEVLRVTGCESFVAQLGGQTPINMAKKLIQRGHQLLGSTLESMDLSEDRRRFSEICLELGLKIPNSGLASRVEDAISEVERIGYPVICRPSYVLGGRRMEVIETKSELESYFSRNADAISPQRPCFIDQFLEGALEIDVDLVRAKDWVKICGVVEHIEAAGVHSGDSMGVLPPQRLKEETQNKVEMACEKLAHRMKVIGHLNLQIAIKDDRIYILEANPRSSRSVPFVAKATGIPIVDLGIAAMLGLSSEQARIDSYDWRKTKLVSVKGVVFPFKKFKEADSILGPEMKSTGESMGRGIDYPEALLKAFLSSQIRFPEKGEVFFSLREKDKPEMLEVAKNFSRMGFQISATSGTAAFFNEQNVPTVSYKKMFEGRPNCVDNIRAGKVMLVINTARGRKSIEDSFGIRRACIDLSIPCLTETDTAEAFLLALKYFQTQKLTARALEKSI